MKDEHDRDTRDGDAKKGAARREPSSDSSDQGAARDGKSPPSGALPHHLRGSELDKDFDDADADSSAVTNRRIDKISES